MCCCGMANLNLSDSDTTKLVLLIYNLIRALLLVLCVEQ